MGYANFIEYTLLSFLLYVIGMIIVAMAAITRLFDTQAKIIQVKSTPLK